MITQNPANSIPVHYEGGGEIVQGKSHYVDRAVRHQTMVMNGVVVQKRDMYKTMEKCSLPPRQTCIGENSDLARKCYILRTSDNRSIRNRVQKYTLPAPTFLMSFA